MPKKVSISLINKHPAKNEDSSTSLSHAELKAAHARGRLGGRPSLLEEKQVEKILARYDEQKLIVEEICKIHGVSRPPFYNYLKKRKKVINIILSYYEQSCNSTHVS